MTEMPRCPLGLSILQRLGDVDSFVRRRNQERLRQVKQAQGETIHIFCAHDSIEWEQCRDYSNSQINPLPCCSLGTPNDTQSSMFLEPE
ncbi:hypothetical protein [Leptolyngbya sp. FACHB-17]|uniref:hypothetical protein n=2 Tax=unclassified Leptolyngbya TaxID=2650499 RepID=UPI00168060AD|nr:hypothetical protein [Leptolyngbya sp. FACHB-17]MBD2079690.1 hypothetical protein [Leptolyngbya sp. FACHB-17]